MLTFILQQIRTIGKRPSAGFGFFIKAAVLCVLEGWIRRALIFGFEIRKNASALPLDPLVREKRKDSGIDKSPKTDYNTKCLFSDLAR